MSVPNPNLTTIHLVGSLGRAIGHHKLTMDVKSPAEAIRAIDIVTRGALGKYLRGPAAKRYYRVAIDKRDSVIGKDELDHRSGRADIWIIPTISGHDKWYQKVIIGALLIATAIFAPAIAPWMTTAIGGATVQGVLMTYGVALVIGGISEALSPRAQGPTQGQEDNTRSSIFQGNASTVAQGFAIPVVYGRALVPPIPIAISIDNNDINLTDGGRVGENDYIDLDGGGVQYGPGSELDDIIP